MQGNLLQLSTGGSVVLQSVSWAANSIASSVQIHKAGALSKKGFNQPGTYGFEGYILQPSYSDTNIPRGLPFQETPASLQLKPNYVLCSPLMDIDNVNYHFSRFMGCFGDGISGLLQVGLQTSFYSFNKQSVVSRLIYRGTKHGLINPTPLFSNAVFNGTRFGQLRDMMEQRQYTRFSLNDSSLTDAAVEVVFIDRSILPDINGSITNNIVSGSFTNSSNVSPFATSEHPYDDALSDSGLIWDRNTPLPETLIAL
jgi:hypothetical protein